MNILICSAGRRVTLVKYFKQVLSKIGGKVVTIDCDPTAAACLYSDEFELVPSINKPEYIPIVRQICRKHNIKGILSLIDPELSLLASYKKEFKKEGITIIVSEKEIVDTCFDKYLTYKILEEHNLPSVPTYINKNRIMKDMANAILTFPLIVKPRYGSASIGIHKVNNLSELEILLSSSQDWVVQPFIKGDELGIDCYVDMLTINSTNIFCKRKLKMRAGETDKSVAVKDNTLMNIVKKLLCNLQLVGPIDIDCFSTEKGYLISEINPRFGGGYPHAHEMGQNFILNIVNNLMGMPNQVCIGNYREGSVMVKHDNIAIINSKFPYVE
jgi:carbamoyl-phosphate synthase large subunit